MLAALDADGLRASLPGAAIPCWDGRRTAPRASRMATARAAPIVYAFNAADRRRLGLRRCARAHDRRGATSSAAGAEAGRRLLGIIYENLFRLVNGYRPVLYDDAMPYALKPYMAGGVVAHPGRPALDDFETFRARANAAYDADFWARPRRAFPYSIAVLRGIGSNAFLFRELQSNLRKAGLPEYAMAFRAERFARELIGVLARFTDAAERHGLRAVAVFLPRNRFDTQSASDFLAARRDRLPAGLVVADAGAAPIDWSRYNLEVSDGDDVDICHPSAYGYDALAEFIAGILRDAEQPRR